VALLPILAHELAHLQHRDLHTLAATRLLLILLWPQPLFWLLRRTIRLDQETLADAAAADRAGRLDYAQQLLAWASTASTQRPPRLAGAVGLWEGPSQLKRRIAVLLNEQFNVMRSCSRRWRGGSLVAIALIAIGLSTVTFQPQAGVANEAGEETANVESPVTDKVESTTETAAVAVAPSDAVAEFDPMIAYLGHRQTENKTPNVIRGRCLDEANKPIADVEVELYRGKRPSGLQRLVTQTKTNAAGEFEFRNVVDPKQAFPDGVVPANFVSNTEMFTVITRQPGRVSREVLADAPFTYREGRSVDVLMPRAASLSGIIKDGAGKPISGARISRNSLSDFPHVFSAVTDVEGRFSIDDLAPFDLEAEKKRKEEEKKAADAQLAAGVHAVLTTSLAPRFTVVHPEFSSQRLPLSGVPSNIDVTLSPGARLRGRALLADGSPAASATVIVKPSVAKQGNGDWGMIDYGKFNIERDYQVTVQTDAEGRFEADSLTPGKVDVWAELPGWLNAGVGEFEVKAGPAASLPDLTFTKGGVIRLQLIDDETGRPIAVDQPLTANVSVIMKNKLGRQETWPDRKKVTDQGVVEIASLPGTAQVMLQSVEAGAEQQWLPAASDWMAYPQAQVVEGQTVDAEFRVRKAPTAAAPPAEDASASAKPTAETTHQSVGMGTLAAVPLDPPKHQPNALELQVVDENKQPLAGVEATLYSASPRTDEAKLLKTLATDDAGNVVFAAVAPADQIAKFEKMKAAGEFIYGPQDSYLIALKRPGLATALIYQSAGDLALAGGKRTIMLRSAVKLSGRVTDPEGKPVPDAVVTAGGFAGSNSIAGVNAVSTDAAGRFEFADRGPFNRAVARKENNFMSFTAAASSPAPQSGPALPEDPTVKNVSDLVVTHPHFAVTRVEGGNVPGGANVQMLAATSIAGRVIDYDAGAPVAGVTVQALGEPTGPPQIEQEDGVLAYRVPYSHGATATTVGEGNYRLENLPAGTYNLWVDSESQPGNPFKRASRGVGGVVTTASKEPAPAPDIVVGRPATVNVQLVDDATSQPLQLDGNAVAVPMVLRGNDYRMQQNPHQRVPISKDGTFTFSSLPGRFRIGVEVVDKPGIAYQVLYRSPDDFDRSAAAIDLKFGENISTKLAVRPMAQLQQLRSEHGKAFELLQAKKFDEAIAAFNEMVAARPDDYEPISARGYAYRIAGRYVEALADAEAMLKRFPEDSQAKYILADLLATSPVEGTRDGKRALKFAEELVAMAKANQTAAGSMAQLLSLVAAAHAESGDFVKAIAAQREAIELAPESRKPDLQKRLELYQSNKPFRREAASPETKRPAEKPADQGASKSPPLTLLVTKAVELPPGVFTVSRAVVVPNPTAGLAQLKSLDLKSPSDSTWHLVPQPASINLKPAATLGDAVN